jgi:hypothetical protein
MAYELARDEAVRITQADSNLSRDVHEFVLATYVPEKRWDEFDKARSMWKLYLVNDNGERVTPVKIRRLKSGDAIAIHFYPYITPWKTVYEVTFPATVKTTKTPVIKKNTASITFVITSVLGTTEMVWDLKGEDR